MTRARSGCASSSSFTTRSVIGSPPSGQIMATVSSSSSCTVTIKAFFMIAYARETLWAGNQYACPFGIVHRY